MGSELGDITTLLTAVEESDVDPEEAAERIRTGGSLARLEDDDRETVEAVIEALSAEDGDRMVRRAGTIRHLVLSGLFEAPPRAVKPAHLAKRLGLDYVNGHLSDLEDGGYVGAQDDLATQGRSYLYFITVKGQHRIQELGVHEDAVGVWDGRFGPVREDNDGD